MGSRGGNMHESKWMIHPVYGGTVEVQVKRAEVIIPMIVATDLKTFQLDVREEELFETEASLLEHEEGKKRV